MKELNQTVWASVTIDTIKATDIWKKYVINEKGEVPANKYNNILNAALYEIGYDIDKGSSYTKNKDVYVRSSNCGSVSNQVLYKTTIYSFPVRDNFKYKDKYLAVDMVHLHADNTEKENYIHIEDFGLEADCVKQNKNNEI